MSETAAPVLSEDVVEVWRFRALRAAGYAFEDAEQIARRADIDLHRAVELVEHGCEPLLAAQIML